MNGLEDKRSGASGNEVGKRALVPEEIPDAEHELVIGAGRGDRCGQGVGQGVCAVAQPVAAGGSAGCGMWPPRTGAVADLAEQLVDLGDREGHCRVDVGLLADLLLPAGGGRAGCAAGQRPRCEERAGPAQRPTSSTRLAGQAHRKGTAAAVVSCHPPPIRELRDYTRLRRT